MNRTARSERPPRRYRLAPLPQDPDGPGAAVWWDPQERCWVAAKVLVDGGVSQRRHDRPMEVIYELERDAVITDQVLRALLADRGRSS